jgi:antitoxin component YwqK of YwqJK toxin-antitoxin module
MANEWYYVKNGQRCGPVSGQQLKELAAKGGIGPDDLVWKEGMSQWLPASKVKGLLPNSSAVTSKPTSPASPTATNKSRTTKPVKKEADPDIPNKSTGMATKTKVLVIGGVATVGVLCLVIVLAVSGWLLSGGKAPQQHAKGNNDDSKNVANDDSKKPTTPQDKTKKPGEQPKDKQNPEIKVTPPDFTKVDYSVPFSEKDYDFDFSKVDYSKGPKGKPLDRRIVYDLHNGKSVTERPRPAGQIKHRVVSSGFLDANSEYVKHGVQSVFTMNPRAIIPGEKLPENPKFASSNRWMYDSDDDMAAGVISLNFSEKVAESHWFEGKQHGSIKMWFPVLQLPLSELRPDSPGAISGDLQFEGFFLHGKAHGKSTIWAKGPRDPKNNFKQLTYKQSEKWNMKGVLHGPDRHWYEDGSKAWEGWWKDGKMHGKWVYWVPSGKKLALPGNHAVPSYGETFLVDGTLHGVETNWYDAERKRKLSEFTYDKGNLLLSIGWWPNGCKSREIVYQDNKELEHREWDENGNLKPPPSKADAMLKRLARGMSRKDVTAFLGQPDARSPLGQGEAWVYFASETESVFISFDTQGELRDAFKQPRKK